MAIVGKRPSGILGAMPFRRRVALLQRLVVLSAVVAIGAGACGTSTPRLASPSAGRSLESGLPAASVADSSSGCAPISPPPGTGKSDAWWLDRTFYEVFVRSFADSDGDGIGDLRGLTQRLDYLNDGDPTTTTDLGVTALWLMPVAESPSYHGYDVTDYQAVEADYGTADDFRALMSAAHARGIEVIVDLVINHTSSDHPWFKDALVGGAHHDWYIWSPTDPGWPSPIGGGDPWRPSDAGYYYAPFWEGMPDLSLRNPDVTSEIKSIASFWLDRMGVDGFRLDAARHLIEDGPDSQVNTPETHAWLAGFRDSVHAGRPDALVVGEVADVRIITSGYTNDGSLDMDFDFEIGPNIAAALQTADAASLLINEGEIATSYPAGGAGTFLSNHDQPRIMSQLHGDAAAAREGAEVLFTMPGVPFIYYGEELGMLGTKPDEDIRTPLAWTASGPGFGFTTGTPWEPFGEGADATNVAAEASASTSLLSTYRDLIRLRATHLALAAGSFLPVSASNSGVAASLRVDGAERLLVVQNLSTNPIHDVALSLETSPLCGTPTAQVVYASVGVVTTVGASVAPVISARGGFSGYVPIPDLPPRATVVLQLTR